MTSAIPLDISRLTDESRLFLKRIMEWKPEWSVFCQMEKVSEGDRFELRVEVPSPTGDDRRTIVFLFQIEIQVFLSDIGIPTVSLALAPMMATKK